MPRFTSAGIGIGWGIWIFGRTYGIRMALEMGKTGVICFGGVWE